MGILQLLVRNSRGPSRIGLPFRAPARHLSAEANVAGRERGKTGFYGVVVGGSLVLFGALGYTIFKELISPSGSYHVIDQAIELLEHNPEAQRLLGAGKLSSFGVGDGRSRRRPIVQKTVLDDGRQALDVIFLVEGPVNRAKVTLQAVEAEEGGWRERYLALDVPGKGTTILIQPPSKVIKRSGWNPFSRWWP